MFFQHFMLQNQQFKGVYQQHMLPLRRYIQVL